jgi:hypothetical protein
VEKLLNSNTNARRGIFICQKRNSLFVKSKIPAYLNINPTRETNFITSYQDVNIHQNDGSASQMGALAYTQGNNVHFAPGQFNPNTQGGQELLGHELTHVVQQRQGKVQPTKQGKGLSVNDNPSLESEADSMGKKAANGQQVDVVGNGSGVQRKSGGKMELKKTKLLIFLSRRVSTVRMI